MNEIQSINQQMALIANLARAYANATPEQRANVSLSDMQAQLNRYNELKARRNELYAEQEARVQAELEAQRRANQQQLNTRGTWRTIVNRWNDRQTFTPTPNTVEVWGVNQSYYPWMSMRTDIPTQQTNTPIYRTWRNNLPNYWVTPWMPDWNVLTWYATPVRTQTQTSAVEQRNAMPWYQQMVTPYSDEYLREIWAISNNTSNTSTSNNNVGPYTAERNNMPWYRQMVTPYSEGYLREQWYL